MLFGLAVLLILTAALSVPWYRMPRMARAGELESARQIVDAWARGAISADAAAVPGRPLNLFVLSEDEAQAVAMSDEFIAEALESMRGDPQALERSAWFEATGAEPRQRYARALRGADLDAARAGLNPENGEAEGADRPFWGMVLVEREAGAAVSQLFINRTYLILAGLLAGALAILVFYFITTRLILSPVRVLRETAERVSHGDIYVRSDISTGDEFEDLSDTFNLMLANLKQSQDQLRQVNKSLDLRLNELTESNALLAEANRLKSEFLANVSHELRTPLNSILGFAEVIQELNERADAGPEKEKCARYLVNIVNSGRALLELINDLLDLAKIEAGRIEIDVKPTSVSDVCEGLATLIRPQAERKRIRLEVQTGRTLPTIETDPGRFEQIVFNFLSNAVKFTPPEGVVQLAADRQWTRERGEMIRISVSDTGPGIAPEHLEVIFEKFRQVDASHTREHQGTGLGLAISQELARLLGGYIEVESEPEKGATFSLLLPLRLAPEAPQSLMPAN
ncbi:MAG: ATP-binding protein [Phycisphaerales bacterium]